MNQGFELTLLSFLCTYLLHSTAWILLVLLVLRVTRPGDGTSESLLRWGLCIGLGTAALQIGLGINPIPGLRLLEPAQLGDAPLLPLAGSPGSLGSGDALPGAGVLPGDSAAESGLMAEIDWLQLGLLVYAGLVAAGLLRSFGRACLWRHRLGRRVEVTSPELLAELAKLRVAGGLRRQVRLTQSEQLDSPVAFGILADEICLPQHLVDHMPLVQQRCVLAHEVAHLRRRDPLWLLVFEGFTTALFLQPLNRLLRRRLQELAEYRCDAWVVQATRDPVGMARALVSVAEWMQSRPQGGRAVVGATAMTQQNSPLARRVQRILETEIQDGRRRQGWVLCALLAVSGLGPLVPAVDLRPVPKVLGPMRSQLIELEQQIGDLHQSLGDLYHKLQGRETSSEYRALLRHIGLRLQRMGEEREVLWRAAQAEEAAGLPPTSFLHSFSDRAEAPR